MQDRRGLLIASGATLSGLATSWSLVLAEPAAVLPAVPPKVSAVNTRLTPALLDILGQRLDDVLGDARLRHTAIDPLRDGELVPLGPHLRQMLGQLFFEFPAARGPACTGS
ncbi:hypothetical protein ACIQWL_54075 [Streptomyces mirabilis]|uniref:hypothetical protein n=1 Tax=Streptomyces mirabilis TaxID=68239 RepID=UPI00324D2CBA